MLVLKKRPLACHGVSPLSCIVALSLVDITAVHLVSTARRRVRGTHYIHDDVGSPTSSCQ